MKSTFFQFQLAPQEAHQKITAVMELNRTGIAGGQFS